GSRSAPWVGSKPTAPTPTALHRLERQQEGDAAPSVQVIRLCPSCPGCAGATLGFEMQHLWCKFPTHPFGHSTTCESLLFRKLLPAPRAGSPSARNFRQNPTSAKSVT